MEIVSAIHLMIKYKPIRLYVRQCYITREYDKLYDFLMDIETEDPSARNLH